MRKIDFIIIGTQKAGTTALYYNLKKHPKIELSKTIEPHFFDKDFFLPHKFYYSKYHENFNWTENRIRGEITPSYLFLSKSHNRIFNYNKNIKIIIILRNPLERAISHYKMELGRDNENLTFEEALAMEDTRIKTEKGHLFNSYLNRSLYSYQLDNIFNIFRKNQVLVLKYENFISNYNLELNKVLNFLKITDFFHLEEIEKRRTNKLNIEINRTKIQDYLQILLEDIDKVERTLNWDCQDWKDSLDLNKGLFSK